MQSNVFDYVFIFLVGLTCVDRRERNRGEGGCLRPRRRLALACRGGDLGGALGGQPSRAFDRRLRLGRTPVIG